jgi:hypothetical protein
MVLAEETARAQVHLGPLRCHTDVVMPYFLAYATTSRANASKVGGPQLMTRLFGGLGNTVETGIADDLWHRADRGAGPVLCEAGGSRGSLGPRTRRPGRSPAGRRRVGGGLDPGYEAGGDPSTAKRPGTGPLGIPSGDPVVDGELAEAIQGVQAPLGWSLWNHVMERAIRQAFGALGALPAAEVAPDPLLFAPLDDRASQVIKPGPSGFAAVGFWRG